MHGNNRNYCTALFTLDEERCRKWLKENGGGPTRRPRQLVKDPRLRDLIQGYVDKVNATLASYETIKKFALLPGEFTRRCGRADREPQSEAEGRREEVQGRARRLLRRCGQVLRPPRTRSGQPGARPRLAGAAGQSERYFPSSLALRSAVGGFGPSQHENIALPNARPGIVTFVFPLMTSEVPVPGS